LGDLRHSILALTAAAFAALTIVVATSDVLLGLGAALMTFLVAFAIVRTIRYSLRPSRFLQLQQKAIRNLVDSPLSRGAMLPPEELKSAEVAKFSAGQQTTFFNNLGNAVIVHRAIEFWSYQLETYRRGPATLFFNGLGYLWLMLRSVLGLAFVNWALYRADADMYDFTSEPTLLDFICYVIACLYGDEINAVQPAGDLTDALSIATFVVGLVVVGSLLLSATLAFRATRDECEIGATISEIKRQRELLDRRIRDESDVSVDEAQGRLEEVRYGLMALINFFAVRSRRIEADDEGTTART
jgi:hypothetical protein